MMRSNYADHGMVKVLVDAGADVHHRNKVSVGTQWNSVLDAVA
jgi:hypothetical protein